MKDQIKKVSIIIPTFNRAEYLKMAIDSALAQIYSNLEVIVLDDCSTDETIDLPSYYNGKKIRFVRNDENLGFVGNWNKGLELASGDYIKIMGDDDLLDHACIAEQARILDKNPYVGVVCCNYHIIDEYGNITTHNDNPNFYKLSPDDATERGKDFIKNYLLKKRPVGWPTAILFRKSDIEKAGAFDPDTGCSADIDMWCRILIFSDFYYLDKKLAFNRHFSGNLSKKLAQDPFGYKGDMHFHFKILPRIENELDTQTNSLILTNLHKNIFNNFCINADEKNRRLVKHDLMQIVDRLNKLNDRQFFTQNQPEVSILLPIYNGAEFLRRAIDSLLVQTFTNFELIILNDGSTDCSQAIIDSYADPRIVRIGHDNMGLHRTLNKGLRLARGRYICRMDQDDIAAPDRLELQVRFLESHPEVSLVGSTSWLANVGGKIERIASYAFADYEIRWFLLFDNPMIHSSVMFRREIIGLSGGYEEDKRYDYAEDYDLWSRMSLHTSLWNIDSPLVTRTDTPGGMSLSNLQKQRRQAFEISARNCRFLVGEKYPLSDADIAILRSAWLGMDLPKEISVLTVLKRLFVTLQAIELLFKSVYRNYSPEEKLIARKWIVNEYQKVHGRPLVMFIRTVFAMKLQPDNLHRLKLGVVVNLRFARKCLKYGLSFSKKLLIRTSRA